MRIKTNDTLAMAVDFQERLLPVIHQKEHLLERSTVLLEGLSLLNIPIIVTRQYPKGLGDTVRPIQETTHDAKVYDKRTFSCYDDPSTATAIDQLNKKNIILCGAEAHVCILQTAIDLQDAGYQVVLVEDCISSRKQSDKDIALLRAQAEGILLTTSEAILFELLRTSEASAFKGISALIK